MKVLLVSPLPPPMGGIATLTKRIIDNMSSADVEFECVNIAHKVDKTNNNITNYGKMESIKILCRSLISVFFKCVKKKCDIIHINSSSGSGSLRDYLIERVANKFHIPVIIHYHCNIEDAVNKNKIAQKLCDRCFSLAAYILVLNKSSQKFIMARGYNSIIVSNGISKNLIVSKHLINENIGNVVFTGRVSKAKGCLELYECAKLNPQITFNLAGLIDENIEDQLHQLNNIKLLGSLKHEEVIDLLDKADVFIFPTYTEGFSISLLEAMARGVPCITTNVGANEDMIENKGGVIIEPQNSQALVMALKEIKEPEVRKSMSMF